MSAKAHDKHKFSSNISVLMLILVLACAVGAIVIFAILQGSPEEIIWAPGQNWGYELPNDQV